MEWRLIGPGDADQVSAISISKKGIIYISTDIGGVYTSNNRGESWKPLNQGINNYDIVTPVVIDPVDERILYIGTRGGIYKSTNGGHDWEAKWKGIGVPNKYNITTCIGAIVLSPYNPNIVFAGVGYRPSTEGTNTIKKLDWQGLLYRSGDRGETWAILASLGTGVKIQWITIAPNNPKVFYVSTNKGLFVSNDEGLTWSLKFKSPTGTLVVHPNNPDVLYIASGVKGVNKSTDGGKTWYEANNGLPRVQSKPEHTDNYSVLLINPLSPNTLYVANSTWGMGGGVYKSINGGNSWEKITKWQTLGFLEGNIEKSWLDISKRVNTLAIDPDNPKRLFAGTSRYIYRTEDQGETWEQLISTKVEENGAWTHRGINVFGGTLAVIVDPSNSDYIYIGTADHGLVKSTDGGKSWLTTVTGMKYKGNIFDIVISKSNPKTIFAINAEGFKKSSVCKSTDRGESWYQVDKGLPNDTLFYSLSMHHSDEHILYVGGSKGVFKTTNGGIYWFSVNVGLENAGAVKKLITNPANTETLFAATDKGIYKTVDGGSKWWRLHNSLLPMNITSLAINPQNTDIIYAGSISKYENEGGLFKSLDGGKTWIRCLPLSRVDAIALLPSNPSVIYAVANDTNYHDKSSGEGVFRSNSGGRSWQSINKGLAVSRGGNISIDEHYPHKVYLSTSGSGVYVTIDPVFMPGYDRTIGPRGSSDFKMD